MVIISAIINILIGICGITMSSDIPEDDRLAFKIIYSIIAGIGLAIVLKNWGV